MPFKNYKFNNVAKITLKKVDRTLKLHKIVFAIISKNKLFKILTINIKTLKLLNAYLETSLGVLSLDSKLVKHVSSIKDPSSHWQMDLNASGIICLLHTCFELPSLHQSNDTRTIILKRRARGENANHLIFHFVL